MFGGALPVFTVRFCAGTPAVMEGNWCALGKRTRWLTWGIMWKQPPSVFLIQVAVGLEEDKTSAIIF